MLYSSHYVNLLINFDKSAENQLNSLKNPWIDSLLSPRPTCLLACISPTDIVPLHLPWLCMLSFICCLFSKHVSRAITLLDLGCCQLTSKSKFNFFSRTHQAPQRAVQPEGQIYCSSHLHGFLLSQYLVCFKIALAS